MSWLNSPPFSIDEAQQRGFDVYEVFYQNWGVQLPDQTDTSNLRWPPVGQLPINPSLAGIAIGPKSTVDRCWVSYNLQKILQNNINGETHIDASLETATNRVRQVSVDSPLIFTQQTLQPGVIGIVDPVTVQTKIGSLFVYPWDHDPNNLSTNAPVYLPIVNSTVYSPEGFLDAEGHARSFPSTEDDPNSGFVGPLLHLYMYLKAPNIAIPVKRAPLICSGIYPVALPDSVETLIAQIATFGRNYVHVTLVVSGNASDVRIGALRVPGYTGTGGGFPKPGSTLGSGQVLEEPVDSAKAVLGAVTMAPCLNGLKADYINLYVTPSGNNASVAWMVTAYD